MDKWNDAVKKIFSKKYVANLLVLLAVAVMALIVSGDFLSFKPAKTTNQAPIVNSSAQQQTVNLSEEELVENRLKRILEEIKGTGTVEVMITFEMGSEIVPALNTVESKDTTEEKDSNGGTRTLSSESITTNTVVSNENGGSKPMVIKEIKPQVKGVIVVAEGAEDIQVKVQLYEAVKTVLQIPGHRVQVYPKN